MSERDAGEGDWNGPEYWRSARGSCHVCAKRWPKQLVGNLGDPVGHKHLNLVSRSRRR